MTGTFNIVPAWEVVVYSQYGIPLAVMDMFEAFSIQRKSNGISTFSITFKDSGDERLTSEYWQLDGVVTFRRDLPYFVDDIGNEYFADLELAGLIRKHSRGVSANGEKIITYEGVSCEHLLSRRVIAYNQGTTGSDKDGYAAQVMCEYVDENCGPSATGGNRWFYTDTSETPTLVEAPGVMEGFVVDWNNHAEQSPNWVGSKSLENLLDAIQEISATTRVDFRVDYVNGGPQFVFAVHPDYGFGSNRTRGDFINPQTGLNNFGYAPVVFSIENETVSDIEGVYDRISEATYAFIIGSGDGSTRAVLPAANTLDIGASRWNQIEVARSASLDREDIDGETFQMIEAAEQLLTEMQYKETVSFAPHQIPKCLYGFHYFLGDLVECQFDRFSAEHRIVGVNIVFDNSGEKIELELEAPVRHIEVEESGYGVLGEAIPAIFQSESPSISPSPTLSASASLSISPSRSLSPSKSLSQSPSPSGASASRSISPSRSQSPSASASRSVSRSQSPSASWSPSVSPSLSPSSSRSASISPSRSLSPSASASRSGSRSLSQSRSVSPSMSASVSPSGTEISIYSTNEAVGTGSLSFYSLVDVGVTPRGVLVMVMQVGNSTDAVTGVTYGGAAMGRVDILQKATGEDGAVYAYFLGTGLLSGNRSIAVTVSGGGGGAVSYHAVSVTFSADADTQINDYEIDISSDSIANPTDILSILGIPSVCVIGFVSGHNSVDSVSPRTNWSCPVSEQTHLLSTYVTSLYRYDDTVAASFLTSGWLQTSEDAIGFSVAICEV